MVQRLLNHYPNYSTHRLYFREVETPYLRLVDDVNFLKLLNNVFSYSSDNNFKDANIMFPKNNLCAPSGVSFPPDELISLDHDDAPGRPTFRPIHFRPTSFRPRIQFIPSNPNLT